MAPLLENSDYLLTWEGTAATRVAPTTPTGMGDIGPFLTPVEFYPNTYTILPGDYITFTPVGSLACIPQCSTHGGTSVFRLIRKTRH